MKLNIKAIRYLSSEDWRVLQAVSTERISLSQASDR